MACQLGATPAAPRPSHVVAMDQYNDAVARLADEARARARYEAELQAARAEVATLRARLADMTACAACVNASSRSAPPAVDAPSESPQGVAPAPRPESAAAEPRPDNSASQMTPVRPDKEILSHCSDISASKGENRAMDLASAKKCPQLKSSSNLVALGASPGVKKSVARSKKERITKSKIPGQSRYWTPEEHKLFLEALNKYGHKDLRAISAYVGTRNMTQVRTHSQKYFMRLMREAKRQNPLLAAANSASDGDSSVAASPPGGQAPGKDQLIDPATSSTPANASIPKASGPANVSGIPETRVTEASVMAPSSATEGPAADAAQDRKMDSDKYSVPNTCGMTLLCLVGQDTLAM